MLWTNYGAFPWVISRKWWLSTYEYINIYLTADKVYCRYERIREDINQSSNHISGEINSPELLTRMKCYESTTMRLMIMSKQVHTEIWCAYRGKTFFWCFIRISSSSYTFNVFSIRLKAHVLPPSTRTNKKMCFQYWLCRILMLSSDCLCTRYRVR